MSRSKWKKLSEIQFFKEEIVGKEESFSIGSSQTGMMTNCVITSTDGREIPVLLDSATRSVYPIRGD